MEDTLGTYARAASLPTTASGSSSFDDPQRQEQQQQLSRGGSSNVGDEGGDVGGGGRSGSPIAKDGSYEAPPSPLPSPMPHIASISADSSSDDFGLGEIFANAESRSQDEAERVGVDGGNDGDVKMDATLYAHGSGKDDVTMETADCAAREIMAKSVADEINSQPQDATSKSEPDGSDGKPHERSRENGLLENGRNPQTPSPKPSNSSALLSVSVSPPRPKDGKKSDTAVPAKPPKVATPKGKGTNGSGAGTGAKPPSGSSKAKGPPLSPPPLPSEEQLAGHRRMACKARSVPDGHTPETAYLAIPPAPQHGMILACSHSQCKSSGKRFRFCVVCDIPVAKRNFLRRHSHGLISGAAQCAAGLAPGLAAGYTKLVGGAATAGSDGTSPPSTPQYDSPTSPRSASSGGGRSDDDLVLSPAATAAGGQQRKKGSRSQGASRSPAAPTRPAAGGVLASPGQAANMRRDEGNLGIGEDPTSPMSTGSVRQRTASDSSNRSAWGSPGKRPREGGSPPRNVLAGAVVTASGGARRPPPQSGPSLGPGFATTNAHLARPLPYRPPPIQHCVSWPMVVATAGGHHHHHAHGAPPPPASPMASPMSHVHGAPPPSPMASPMARGLVMRPSGAPPPQWGAPTTPGAGAAAAVPAPQYPTAAAPVPHYDSWSAGSPRQPQHQQQTAPPTASYASQPPSNKSMPPPPQQYRQHPQHPGAPQIPHTSTLGAAAPSSASATVATPKAKGGKAETTTPGGPSQRQYLHGPAMSFDTALDRDRKTGSVSAASRHQRYSSGGDERRRGDDGHRGRTLSPGLVPELGRSTAAAAAERAALLRGSRSDDDADPGPSLNDDRNRSWARSSAPAGRIEFRRRSPPPYSVCRPEASIWRMQSDSALPGPAPSARGSPPTASGAHSHPPHRARQTSESLPPSTPASPPVRPFAARGASEDDFEPPTPELSVMRLDRRERMWLNLLRRRPFEEEAGALRSWVDEVMSISDPRGGGGGDGSGGSRSGANRGPPRPSVELSPRALTEVVRHARVSDPSSTSSRRLREDLEREGRGGGDRTEAPKVFPTPTPTSSSKEMSASPTQEVAGGRDSPVIAETRGDRNAADQAGGRDAASSQSSPSREDPKIAAGTASPSPPERGVSTIAEKMTEGLAGLFGCGALLCADDGAVGGGAAAPCAPCANTGAVDDAVIRRSGGGFGNGNGNGAAISPSARADLSRPLPVSHRQQSKSSVASSVSMGAGSAAAFFENTAIMDIDPRGEGEGADEALFGRGMPRGGSVSSASVSQIGDEDMDDLVDVNMLGGDRARERRMLSPSTKVG